jgi:hypothetical protein
MSIGRQPVGSRVSFKTSVCAEYAELLHSCKAAFDECRKHSHAMVLKDRQNAHAKDKETQRLREEYEECYRKLVRHSDQCRVCRLAQHRARVARLFSNL